MAVNMAIKIEGIEGECTTSGFEKQIDVLSWSWGLSQSGNTHTGGGGTAGKVNVQDLSLTKYVDKSSAKLQLHCCNGKHIPTATVTVRKAGGDKPVDYLKIKLTDLIISSVSTGGSGGEDRLTENVSLNFAKIEYEYVEQKADGTGGSPDKYGWDVKKNEKV